MLRLAAILPSNPGMERGKCLRHVIAASALPGAHVFSVAVRTAVSAAELLRSRRAGASEKARWHQLPRAKPVAMRVLRVISPGRFPTVVHDPGEWYSVVAEHASVKSVSLNFQFWQYLFSTSIDDLPQTGASPSRQDHQRSDCERDSSTARATRNRAGVALKQLRSPGTYSSSKKYLTALSALSDHLGEVNRSQKEFHVTLESGPFVFNLDYSNSHQIAEFASGKSLLASIIEVIATKCFHEANLVVFSATSPIDLLTAMISARIYRAMYPNSHLCLGDHSYENFSLTPHLDALKRSGALNRFFDTIIEVHAEKDQCLEALAARIADGEQLNGFLRLVQRCDEHLDSAYKPIPLVPTFSPKPILWTRLSPRKCYWSKCTFCVQNLKHADRRLSTKRQVGRAIELVKRNVAHGVEHFLFSDESVSPSFAKAFSTALLSEQQEIFWSCRTRVDPAFNARIFQLMRAAGCYELLFGLETIAEETLATMGKYHRCVKNSEIERVLQAAADSGISLHICLIAGFPGDSPANLYKTVDFLEGCLGGYANVTYRINRFSLFPGSTIAANPKEFGISKVWAIGDIPMGFPFEVDDDLKSKFDESLEAVPALERRLDQKLGVSELAAGELFYDIKELYFSSGHGAIFKTQRHNSLFK